MQTRCRALATQRIADLPARKPKKILPEKSTVMLVVTHAEEVLLEQRPPMGIWGGLLSLPELDRLSGTTDLPYGQEQLAVALATFGEIETVHSLPAFTHGFTHYRLRVTPVHVVLRRRYAMAAQSVYQWRSLAGISNAALPSPVRKLLAMWDSVARGGID